MNPNSPGYSSLEDDIEMIGMDDVAEAAEIPHHQNGTMDAPPYSRVAPAEDSDDEDLEHDEGSRALLDGWGDAQPSRRERLLKPFGKLWPQIHGIVIESAPTLLLTTISLLFTGKLLDQVSRWRAMREVDQLIMIIPVVLNLKGNLEMNLSARLGTAANVGELDDSEVRRSMIIGNLSLLQVQAIAVSFIAACISLILGLVVPRNAPMPPAAPVSQNGTIPTNTTEAVLRQLVSYTIDPRRPIPHVPLDAQRKSEGYFRFIMVASTTMTSACLSGLILGSFMCTLIVLCRKYNRDPDNIAPAIASCLGDLVTLCLIGLVSTLLIPFLHTPLPFIIGIITVVWAVACFIFTLRNQHVRPLLGQGWTPLFGAMIISSGTGIVLDMFVSRYEGFAVLAVVISGLPGAAGSIFVSRLSTALHAAALSVSQSATILRNEPSPRLVMITLLVITLPVEIIFLSVLHGLGWLNLPFIFVAFSVFFFCCAVLASLIIARFLTNWLWSKNRDPDMYALPIHSALMDLIGQLLLVLCFEIVSRLGAKVRMKT
ncbi:solute carrier family 41 member 1 [Crucibulum laeve]|uniref:Solute carrier family 41 member 1 n=1 Tax=Crucibulum laeve TaxID=68775 RepID=A0A5C3LGZ7_9AGAR|nr:solute carrier family 41 member 1 [Crucibulum laeve]